MTTRALSKFAIAALRAITDAPMPPQELNAGVVARQMRDGLVQTIELPSPYKTHKARPIAHLRVSEAGLNVLRNQGAP